MDYMKLCNWIEGFVVGVAVGLIIAYLFGGRIVA